MDSDRALKQWFDDIAYAQRQITEAEQQLQILQRTVSTLSWWESLWKTTELESQMDEVSNQIKYWKGALTEIAPQDWLEVDKWSCGGVISRLKSFGRSSVWMRWCIYLRVVLRWERSKTIGMHMLVKDRAIW